MRVPLSWLRDFAPFGAATDDAAVDRLSAALVGAGPRRRGRRAGGRGPRRRGRGPGPRDPAAPRRRQGAAGRRRSRRRRASCRSCAGPSTSAPATWWPLAPVGATLPNGMEIGRRKVRGQWSDGHAVLGRRAEAGHRPRRDHGHRRDRRRRSGHAARRTPSASAPTWCSTSTSPPTGPTPCRWPAWPATWPPTTGCRSPSRSRRPCPTDGETRGHGRRRLARPLSPVHGRRRRGRHRRAVADLAGQPADEGRHAADQQRGRRLQLRDARAGPAQPPLRPRPPARAGPLGAAGPARRDASSPSTTWPARSAPATA